jgi:hypothetical protein
MGFLDPQWFPHTVAAVLMGLLAVWLLFVDFNKPSHRVFAAILIFRAASILISILRFEAPTPALALYWHRVLPYSMIPIAPLTLYFLCVYPRPRTWFGKSRWGAPTVVGSIIGMSALYAWDHSWLWTFEPSAGFGLATPIVGYAYTDFGPLVFVTQLRDLAFSLVTVFLVLDYLDTADRSPRFSAMLIYAGFTLNSLFDGAIRFAQLTRGLGTGPEFPWFPWGWAFIVPPALSILPVALSLSILWSRRKINPDVHRDVRRLLWIAPLPLLSGLLIGFGGSVQQTYLAGRTAQFAIGIWRLTLPILVSYALLRYDLFDIDHRVKSAVKHGTLIGAPVSVFFAVSEIAEGLIQNQVGLLYGAVAMILISLAFKPLERAASHFAVRLFPRVKPFDTLSPAERAALFDEQLRLAQQDGSISAKEERMLTLLGQRLGLPTNAILGRAPRAARY